MVGVGIGTRTVDAITAGEGFTEHIQGGHGPPVQHVAAELICTGASIIRSLRAGSGIEIAVITTVGFKLVAFVRIEIAQITAVEITPTVFQCQITPYPWS